MSLNGLAVFIARGDLTRGGVDEHIERLRKGGTALDMMVADQPEDTPLSEDGCFVIERAVAKAIGKPRSNPIAVSDLNEIAHGEGGAFERLEDEESVKSSLGSAYWNRIGGHLRCCEKTDRDQKQPPQRTI
jgi:hypothetical protein